MTDWQPIDTAPRDGTWVLLKGGAFDRFDAPTPPIAVARYVDGAWAVPNWDCDTDYVAPTHWMLPP